MASLDLSADVVTLTQQLVDTFSVSHHEQEIADAVEAALSALPHLTVTRRGHTVVARTELGRGERVAIAGHLDTVPIADNVPSRRDGDRLYGCGTSDMKAGVAVMAHLTAALATPAHDVTLVLYDCEEIEATRNGLGRIERDPRPWLDADLAVLRAPVLPDLEVAPLTTVEQVAGACYVLEGATLGGAVVARALPDVPHRFFTSYGSRRGAMWAGFRGHLSVLDERGVDRQEAVDAARRTFGLFERACA